MGIVSDQIAGFVQACQGVSDPRKCSPNLRYTMSDIVLGAFSVFFVQSPSFLSHQKRLQRRVGDSNARTLFSVGQIPTDSQIRWVLDQVDPKEFNAQFRRGFETLEASRAWDDFRVLDDRIVIALDGTQHYCSHKISCPVCKTTQHHNGQVSYSHGFVGASLCSPNTNHVLALEPEFLTPQDGHDKQDCENAAAKRWLEAHGRYYKIRRAILCGDDLYGTSPLCRVVTDQGLDFIFVAKPSSHASLYKTLEEGAQPQSVQVPDESGGTTTYRFATDLALTAQVTPVKVNWVAIEVSDAQGAITYRNSWITTLPVEANTVAEIVACARARWKIENETFNTLKQQGYHLEHNYGHGKKHLSNVLAALNLLAFALHTLCDLLDEAYKEINHRIKHREGFFEEIRTLLKYQLYDSWEHLFNVILSSFLPAKPPKIRHPRPT